MKLKDKAIAGLNLIILFVIFSFIFSCDQNESSALVPNEVIPSKQQILYQQMEFIGFIHFSINTYTDKEWGYGDESPDLFNPTHINTDQWAMTALEAGMKELILTAKHHDGFCLWPASLQNIP